MRALTVVITNQKGGVGKSTTAEALAEGLAIKGHRALLVDLDPQCSATMTSGARPGGPTTYEVMTRLSGAQEAIQQHAQEDAQEGAQGDKRRADIIPASRRLAGLDLELTSAGKEYRLRERLATLLELYAFIVLDTPPSLGILTVNALTAADALVIPAQADAYSLMGIGQLMETVGAVKAYTNPGLAMAGVLLTRHNPRTVLSRDMAAAAAETAGRIGTFLYGAAIRESVAVKEAQASRRSIYGYAPKSNAAADYTAFTDEFLERTKSNGIH